MVDGQPGVNARRDVLRLLADAGHISAAGHAQGEQQVVQHEAGGHHAHGPVQGEQLRGEGIRQAQEGQRNAVENRYLPFPIPLDAPADEGLRDQPDDAGNEQGFSDVSGRLAQRADHQPEAEGQIKLLADAVQDFQPVINGIPALEDEALPPAALLRKDGRFHPAQEQERQQAHAARNEKVHGKRLVEFPLDPYAQRAQQRGRRPQRLHLAEPQATVLRPRRMDDDGINHAHQNVLPQAHRQNPRRQRPQAGSGAAEGQRVHAAEHQQARHPGHAHLIEHEKQADHKKGQDAGQFPGEFNEPAHLHVQMLGVTQEVAENEIIHAASELAQKESQQHKNHRLPDAGGSGFTHRAGILSQVHRRSNRYFYPPAFPGI